MRQWPNVHQRPPDDGTGPIGSSRHAPIGVKIRTTLSGGHEKKMGTSASAGGRGQAMPHGRHLHDGEGQDP